MSMILWKVAEAKHNLKGYLTNLYIPQRLLDVRNAEHFRSLVVASMSHKSIFEKIFPPQSFKKTSSRLGGG